MADKKEQRKAKIFMVVFVILLIALTIIGLLTAPPSDVVPESPEIGGIIIESIY